MGETQPKVRLDKWLWFARFFKTRSLAAKTVSAGHVRVNSQKVLKPSTSIGAGDVLTFAQAKVVRVVRVVELGARRGPAPEAQALYEDLSKPEPRKDPAAPRYDGGGRPTKRDRRALDQSRDSLLE